MTAPNPDSLFENISCVSTHSLIRKLHETLRKLKLNNNCHNDITHNLGTLQNELSSCQMPGH